MKVKISTFLVLGLILVACQSAPKKETIQFAKNGMPYGAEEGYMAPEINLLSPENKAIALSSLQGKYVLVNFWASWCRPCMAELPELITIYQNLKPKGLEIYSVSLDVDRQRWVNTIQERHINWIQVSDFKKWDSAPLNIYGVESIPANFVIDKEGKIIAKNLRGQELESFLNKLFKQ